MNSMDYDNSRLHQVRKLIGLMTQRSAFDTEEYKHQAIFLPLPNSTQSTIHPSTRYFQVREENRLKRYSMQSSSQCYQRSLDIRRAKSLPHIKLPALHQKSSSSNLKYQELFDLIKYKDIGDYENKGQLKHKLIKFNKQEHHSAKPSVRSSLQQVHSKMKNERLVRSCIEKYRSAALPDTTSLTFTKTQLHPHPSKQEVFSSLHLEKEANAVPSGPIRNSVEDNSVEDPGLKPGLVHNSVCNFEIDRLALEEQTSESQAVNTDTTHSTTTTTVFLTDLPQVDLAHSSPKQSNVTLSNLLDSSNMELKPVVSMQKEFLKISSAADYHQVRDSNSSMQNKLVQTTIHTELDHTQILQEMDRNKSNGVDYVQAWLHYHSNLGYLQSEQGDVDEELESNDANTQSHLESASNDRRVQFLPIKDISVGSLSSETSHYTTARQPWSSNPPPLSAKSRHATPVIINTDNNRRPNQLALQTRILNNTARQRSAFSNRLLDLHIGITEQNRRSMPSLPSWTSSQNRVQHQHTTFSQKDIHKNSRPRSEQTTLISLKDTDINLRMDNEDSSFVNFVRLNRSANYRLRNSLVGMS